MEIFKKVISNHRRGYFEKDGNDGFFCVVLDVSPEIYNYRNYTLEDLKSLQKSLNEFVEEIQK